MYEAVARIRMAPLSNRSLLAVVVPALLPIILVTSERAEGSVETGFACGCSDYVLKPIDRIELLAKIDNFLSAGSGGISQD